MKRSDKRINKGMRIICKHNKKAQQMMSMPFGMIFSIILIIVFLVVAFMVIRHFLGLQKCSEIALFAKDLQDTVDKVWKSSTSTENFAVKLPGSLDEVCFVDFTKVTNNKYSEVKSRYSFYKPNFFFYPTSSACEMPYLTIKYINATQATENTNPLCIKNDGFGKIRISKEFYDSLVRISKE